MPRFRVIREGTRTQVADPFSETGWWVLDESGTLAYVSLLDTQVAQRGAWLLAARQEASDAAIFDYLDAYGGDQYFSTLSLPEGMEAETFDELVMELKRAQNLKGVP